MKSRWAFTVPVNLWSIEHFGVTPDILVFAKSLTNGLNPLGGLWAREELINPTIFPPGSTHSTFASNPLGTALGLEVMQMLKETDYETMVMAKGAHFLEGLKDLQKRHKEIGDVDGLGLALRAEICTDDGFTPNKALLDKMVEIGLSGDLDWKGKKMGLILDVADITRTSLHWRRLCISPLKKSIRVWHCWIN